MEKIDLVKRVLDAVEDQTFSCDVNTSESAYRDGGFDTGAELNLSAANLIALIKAEVGNDDLFDGYKTEDIDVESVICSIAQGAVWPDNQPYASGDESISDEFLCYGGSCEELKNYVVSAVVLIYKILEGEVGENEIDDWLEFFEVGFFECNILDWREV